ncbi:moonshiner [Drosophila subpulchrella]|uniref:moonshiner n=1 Tax=Drosophila subpulchrella TaxID=1486046 RepID=UPI0018A149EB|nr:moonshiner [Drosophila subpulchrella]
MAGRMKKLVPTDGKWIPESRRFPLDLISSVMSGLRGDVEGVTPEERQSLKELQKTWLQKLANRLPESNPRPPSPKRPRLRAKKKAPQVEIPPAVEEREEYNIHDVEDSEVVRNRICIPRLRSHWKLRYFEIMMPAFVLKRGLLNEHFNWEIVDKIMGAPDEEATAFLQEFVDDVVKDLTP